MHYVLINLHIYNSSDNNQKGEMSGPKGYHTNQDTSCAQDEGPFIYEHKTKIILEFR